MAVHRPLGRLGLQAGCRKNALLLLAVLLCFQPFTQHAAARVMARTPELQAAAGQTAVAQSAAGKPQPEQVPMQQPTAAPPATAAATDAQQQTRLAASRQARAAAQGSKQHGAPLPLSTAAAKREAWKAAFRARQAAGAAAAASTIAVASAGAEGQPRPQPQVVEGIPELIPLPLLFGELKYTNPQLSRDGKFLAYIKPAPQTGVSNVFIRRLPQPTPPAAAAAVAARSSSSPPAAAQPLRTAFESSARSTDAARLAREQRSSIFEREGTDFDQQITFDLTQGVSAYSWTEDSSSILYIQDSNGDENYHLYLVPISKPGEALDLTPFPGVKAQDIVCSELHPDKLFIGLNKRDPSIFDLYMLDMPTLTLSLHTVNPGEINNWLMDYDFKIRGAEGYDNSNGASYVLVNDDMPLVAPERRTSAWRTAKLAALRKAGQKPVPAQANFKPLEALFARAQKEAWGTREWVEASSSKADVSTWRRHITWPFGEEGGVFKFTVAGDAMYVISSLGRDTTELQLVSAAPGAQVLQRIASHPLANVNSVEFNPRTYEPQIVSFNYLKVQWTLLDASLKEEWGRIEALRPGEEVTIVDRSMDEKVWILAYTSDSVNSKYYLHRRGSWPPELLLDTQPDLLDYSVARTHPVVIPARDGLLLPSYLTLPVKASIPTSLPECVSGPVPDLSGRGGVRAAAQRSSSGEGGDKGDSTCPLDLKLPLVLYVHGGPWSRDTWGADPVVQLLTNRGYAVLQVNYRASSGYGKRFMNLGDKQWGVGTMQHDLTDSVRWAVQKGIADPKKVCISGGSYGGYATLAGLAFTPELYACGIDLVGISNVGTFMRSIPPYWKPLQYEWTTRVGPADVDEALNRRISPLYHVHQIKAPLMIAQGAHDPRVPQAESDQMFRAMHTKGRPVQYVLYTDEGHGMSKPQNRKDYYSRVEQFLARYLGGRAAPPLRGLEGVSAIEIKNLADLAAVADFANRDAKDLPVALVKAAATKPVTVAKAASTSAPTPAAG